MVVIQHGRLLIRHFVNPFKSSNSFLIGTPNGDELWLFVIGDYRQISHFIGPGLLKGLFITHSHFDHIAGIQQLLQKHPECIVFGSKKCIEWISDDRKNLSLYFEMPLNFTPPKSCIIDDNSIINLTDEIQLRAISTPGHASDSMTYILENLIITGDAYIPKIPPVTKLRGGNREEYFKSLLKIKDKIQPETLILPGHGPVYFGNQVFD